MRHQRLLSSPLALPSPRMAGRGWLPAGRGAPSIYWLEKHSSLRPQSKYESQGISDPGSRGGCRLQFGSARHRSGHVQNPVNQCRTCERLRCRRRVFPILGLWFFYCSPGKPTSCPVFHLHAPALPVDCPAGSFLCLSLSWLDFQSRRPRAWRSGEARLTRIGNIHKRTWGVTRKSACRLDKI